MIAFDCETHPIKPGMMAPKLVCASFAWKMSDGGIDSVLHEPEQGLITLEGYLGRDYIIGHNVGYDFGVCCAEDLSLLPKVFEAYQQGTIRDTLIRQQLIDIARGNLKFYMDDDGEMIKSSHTLTSLAEGWLGKVLTEALGESKVFYGAP